MQSHFRSLTMPTYGIVSSMHNTNANTNNMSNYNNNTGQNTNNKNNTRAVIIAFDDAWKSQFTYAMPILDRFGYKGSFFIVCNYVGKSPDRMTWADVQTLERNGHDIESHSMNHIRLDDLSQQQLNYEIGQSKQCIIDHSDATTNNSNSNNVPIFAYPYDIGHTNITVINTVAKYYQLGRSGDKPLAFLNCDLSLENRKNGSIIQADYFDGVCRHVSGSAVTNNTNNESNMAGATYYDTLLRVNKYSIRSWTHHAHHSNNSYNGSQMFDQFVQEVNSQNRYNHEGIINTIPIVTYHNLTNISHMTYSRDGYNTDINLFAREIKYLHDNNFLVIPMSAIAYNQDGKYLYIK